MMLKIIAIMFVTFSLAHANFVKRFEKLKFEQKENAPTNGKIWVLLVAGSNGYYNYRHQADVCHSYQVVHNHGIPDEQIVVMMYDDIAYSSENPTQGIIINHPDGDDVYHGVPKDYTKRDVTPKNFLNVLTGNKQAMAGIGSGKVIESGPNDYVFVYFADHGAPGLIAFPVSELRRDDLNDAIMTMYHKKQYAQMVIYIEACESGSMFEDLLKTDINVFATTAADPNESSYACYYDEKRGTYLGDRYSVSWLEDSDTENLNKESLQKQYTIVKKETTSSHVMEYGDMSLSSESVGLFQGKKKSAVSYKPLRDIRDDVPSPDVPLFILRHRLAAAKTDAERLEISTLLSKEQEIRRRIEWTVNTIAHHATGGHNRFAQVALLNQPKLSNYTCYKKAVSVFDSVCYELDDHEYAYRQLYVFGNLCDSGIPSNKITESIRFVCK